MIKGPCQYCAARYTACHDTCQKFKDYKDARNAENEAIRKAKYINHLANYKPLKPKRKKEGETWD